MLSRDEFIRLSLELTLFFGRIAKEHSFFLESGFTAKDTQYVEQAENFKVQFEGLLAEAIALANGVISPEVIQSGELVTPLTLPSEQLSQFYTGIRLNTNLTQAELGLGGSIGPINDPMLEQRVFQLNQKAITLTTALAQFKQKVLTNVVACRLFTTNYPLLLNHILREALFYLQSLQRLQNRESIFTQQDFLENEIFWNRIMGEHALFIRGLLDPGEVALIRTANSFGNQFAKLTQEAIAAAEQTMTLPQVTQESYKATAGIKEFKTAGTNGLINCSIKAIALPLLGDHVVREANHYLRILKQYQVLPQRSSANRTYSGFKQRY